MTLPSMRLKVLRFHARSLLELLKIKVTETEVRAIALPVCPDIPEGIQVISVNADWASTSIDVLASHPLWDEVPEGLRPPIVPIMDEWRMVPGHEFLGGGEPQWLDGLPSQPGYYWHSPTGTNKDMTLVEVLQNDATGETFTKAENAKTGLWARAQVSIQPHIAD